MTNINIGGRLHSTATGNTVVGANEILDDSINKKQSEINAETYRLVENINNNLKNLSPEQTEALSVAEKANNNEIKLGYFECETESDIAAKVITNAVGYILSKGGSIKIKMINDNIASNVTLNINSTGAKTLYYNNKLASPTNTWKNNEIIEVYYDGNNYYANNIECIEKFATGERIKEVGIDDEPTSGSENLVKSGGVYTNINKQSVVQKVVGIGDEYTRTVFRGVLPGHIYDIHVKNINPSVSEVGTVVFIVSQGTSENYTREYEVSKSSLPLNSSYLIKIPYNISNDYEIVINTKSDRGYEQYFYLEDITNKYLVVIGQGSKYTRNIIKDVIPNHKYRIYVKNTSSEISEIPQEVQASEARLLIYKGTKGNYIRVSRVAFDDNPLQPYYDVDIPDNISEDYEIVINTMSNGGYMQYFSVEDITLLAEIWDSIKNINKILTSTVYNDNNIKGTIIITDDSANISKVDELDSIAYENLTYRDIFETNNFIGIAAGFENGSYSPLTINVGTPKITTEDTDSGVYSLKVDGTSSSQLKSSIFPVGLYFYACRAKCTRYVTGKLGVILGSNAAGLTSVTQDYQTCVNSFRIFEEHNYRFFVGSISSADLDGYIDTPVAVDSSIFTEVPTKEKFTELYNTYVSIKKYSKSTIELIALETKKSNRITVLSENIGEEVGYITASDGGKYHNVSNYYQGELIDISSIKGEYIKLIPRTGIPDTNSSAFTLLKDNILQDGEAPNFADGWGVQALVSPTELLIPSDANYLWVYTYRDSAKYIYVAPYVEIPIKHALSVLWEKHHSLYTYTNALDEFISEMNVKSSRLGMTNTKFTSPSGLDYDSSTANYSTAKDMLKLMIEALSYPRLMKVWGMPSWTMKVYGARARDIELESTVTNPAHDPNLAILLDNYNILGGKTGSITIGGVAYYNYCVIAEKNNKFIVATLYKASSSSGRYSQMKTLLDNAFGLLNDSSYTTSIVNAKCACCELPNVPTSILQNHLPPLIYSEEENDKVFIASTTKIMTCIIACEVLKNIDQLYYVKTDDIGGSGDDLNPGDISSFEDMMMDTMLPSSNGCAHCIARIAGNILLENKKYM